MVMTLSLGNVWAADSGLEPSEGVFIIDFYDSDKLSSSSGTGLTSSNYKDFVKVADGLTATNVVTGVSVTGTVQYGKNGGLTAGTSSNTSPDAHFVSFSIGSDYAVKKVTVYATLYDSGRWRLNGNLPDKGALATKASEFSNVTNPLVWDNLDNITTLTFKRESTSGGNCKRVTIYTIVCEYETSKDPTISGVPTSDIDFGTVKQRGSLDNQSFTLTGKNLTSNLTLSADEGFVVSPSEITPTDGAVEQLITISHSTETAGDFVGTLTISGGGLTDDATVDLVLEVTATYAVNVAVAVEDEEGAQGNTATIGGGASIYGDAETTDVAIVATPYSGYEFVNWTASADGKITIADANSASTTVSDVKGEVSLTANFRALSCTVLDAPTLNGEVAVTYQSATISWNEVEKATSYVLNVTKHEDGTEIVKDFSPEPEAELTKAIADLEANTEYDYTIQTIGDGTDYCAEGKILYGSFTTSDYPAATLTLSENGATRVWGVGLKLNSKINLPTEVADGNEIAGKVLVGWSANAECSIAPEFAKGAEYTMNAKVVTLYAVYATETPGEKTTKTDELDYDFTGLSGTSYKNWSGKVGASGAVYAGQSNALGSATTTFIQLRNQSPAGIVSTASGAGKVSEVRVTWNSSTGDDRYITIYGKNTAYTGSSELYGEDKGTSLGTIVKKSSTKLTITGEYDYIGIHASGALYMDKIEIDWTETADPTYSDYTTTGVKAPAVTVDPTSVEIGAGALVGGKIDATYTNVDMENVAVALFNDAECTEAFDGGWLTASLDANKDIDYGASAAVSYANVRTAYIKLTAPSTDAKVDPAVVVIPVEQAKKAAVFASIEELKNSDLPRTSGGTVVTVSFSNVEIASVNDRSVYLNIADAVADPAKNIQIYGPSNSSWAAGGLVSGTNISGTWKLYSGAMELAVSTWEGISYTARYAVTIAEAEHGTVVVKNGDEAITSGDLFAEGAVLTVEASPVDANYRLTALTAGETDILAAKEFEVGTAAVVVAATFAEKEAAPISWSAATGKAYLPLGVKESILPTLTNTLGLAVTYSSETPATATISNEEDHEGEISIVAAGSTVIKATYTATAEGEYKTTEVSYTLTVYAPASVVVTGDASKKAYEAGETFSFEGLGAKATYADEAEYEIPAEEITWAPAEAPAINEDATIKVTATWQGLTSAIKNVAVTVNTHQVSIDSNYEHGTVKVTLDAEGEGADCADEYFVKGTTLYVIATPEEGYKVASIKIAENASERTLEGNSFEIGTSDVTVIVSFSEDGGGTAVDNTEVGEKVVKSMENGVLIIRRGDKTYNGQGQLVK